MPEVNPIEVLFDAVVIKEGDHFPRLRSTVKSRDLAHLMHLMQLADALVRGAARHGFRLKVIEAEVTICSPRYPTIAFYARPVAKGSTVSFNFHPTKDARLTHLRLTEGQNLVVDTYYCFHRRLPADVESFLETVRAAEDALS
jgi:hypothetical protein